MDRNENTNIAILKELEKIKTSELLLRNSKRVRVFTAVDALTLLGRKKFTADQIRAGFSYLLEEGIVFKVVDIPDSPNAVDISLKPGLNVHDKFMFTKQNYSWIYKMLILIITGISITLYVPSWYRYFFYYIRYPVFAFMGFLFISAIVRWIVFFFTLFLCTSQLWIWPNLFADCGFFESFVPLYEWTKNDGDEKTKED